MVRLVRTLTAVLIVSAKYTKLFGGGVHIFFFYQPFLIQFTANRLEVGSKQDEKWLTYICTLCVFQNVVKLLQWCVYEDMVSFLSSAGTVQESAMTESVGKLVGREKAVKDGGIDGKIAEENKIKKEIEEFEEEKGGVDDDDDDDCDDDDDVLRITILRSVIIRTDTLSLGPS